MAKNWSLTLADVVTRPGVAVALILVSVLPGLYLSIHGLRRDFSLESVFVTQSTHYDDYKKFKSIYGKDDYLILTIHSERSVRDPDFLEKLRRFSEALERIDGATEVISLTNVSMFRDQMGPVGFSPVVREQDSIPMVPAKTDLDSRL